MYNDLSLVPIKPENSTKYPAYNIKFDAKSVLPGVMNTVPKSDNQFVATDVVSGDIAVLQINCDGFQISITELRRITSGCRNITSLCCDKTFVFFVSAGIDGGLFKASFEGGQGSLIVKNDEKMDALAVCCDDKSVALSNSKDGSITVFEKNSMIAKMQSGKKKEAIDGLETAFEQPSAMHFNVHESLVVVDTAVGQVKMFTLKTSGLTDYLECIHLLNLSFRVHMKGIPKPEIHIDNGIQCMETVVNTLEGVLSNASSYQSARAQMQGPQGTPASKTVESVRMIQNRLVKLQQLLIKANPL